MKSDSDGQRLWAKRQKLGLARERVSAQLDPPISAKTLERWEKGESPVPEWRRLQLDAIYAAYRKAAA